MLQDLQPAVQKLSSGSNVKFEIQNEKYETQYVQYRTRNFKHIVRKFNKAVVLFMAHIHICIVFVALHCIKIKSKLCAKESIDTIRGVNKLMEFLPLKLICRSRERILQLPTVC